MRNRSSAIAITNNAKMRMSQDLSSLECYRDEEKRQKITEYFEDKLKIKRRISNTSDNNISIPPPRYLDTKKEYSNNNDKVKTNKNINSPFYSMKKLN